MSELLAKQTRLQRSIERFLDNFRKVGKGNLTAAKIRSRIAALKELWCSYQEGHDQLTKATPTKSQTELAYFQDDYFAATEEVYQTTLDFMSDWLEELEPFVSPNQSMLNASVRAEASAFSLSHLPAIRLPPFDGNYAEWEPFRDCFTALIRNNKDLDNFARMHFLSSCLKGRALECIGNISVTADNFEIAWHALTSRYENKRRSLNVHLTTLLNLPALSRESASDLQSLYDKVNVAVSSLLNLKRKPEELWNDILAHIVTHKLDPTTRKAWNLKETDKDSPPSYEDLNRFLQSRVRALENFAPAASTKPSPPPKVHAATASATTPAKCPLCPASHLLSACPLFVGKNSSERWDLVKQHKRCFNCLSEKHSSPDCKSKYSCRVCHKKHHSMLHSTSNSSSALSGATLAGTISPDRSSPQTPEPKVEVTSMLASKATRSRSQVLLATAWITVRVPSGRDAVVRALLDQGSEMTFVSENLAQLLHAKRIRMPISVTAVGGIHAGTFRHATQLFISPRETHVPSFATTALILGKLTDYTPKRQTDVSSLSHLINLPWADPDPTSPDPIQIIIGADLYNDLILDGVRKGGLGQPIAQNSVFGWVISGPLTPDVTNSHSSTTRSASIFPRISMHHTLGTPSLESELRRFWEVEELPRQSILTPQDKYCEEHFRLTHSRDPDGRYVVRLPFKRDPPIDIGASRSRAETMLHTSLRRFSNNSSLAKEYKEFLSEYERLGHMREALPQDESGQHVYLPHHGVIREGSATTHLRVVFNASSLTSNGTSLNDHLHAGPKLQTEITAVISRWRKHRYVYTADIAKMYRQIRLDSRDTNDQRILWKASLFAVIIVYILLTITYGMICAPFLALRVLKQVVRDEGHRFPLAVAILSDNIYVDDVLFGADDLTLLKQARDQLIALLRLGKFELKKWASNSPGLLADIDPADHGLACNKQLAEDEQLKILGIGWNPTSDIFEFRVSLADALPESKRSILSTIAKFYDPLGWVTPVTITAKIFMQSLWRETLNWDDVISAPLLTRWKEIHSRLSHLNRLQIPRWTGLGTDTSHAEVHGFADASNAAYAAVVYLRIISSDGQVTITLITGKSKVAPLRTLSVPRLELLAALLLARLMEFVRESLGCSFPEYCWTDSEIVRAWITSHPSRWKTFVANRVTEIQSRLPRGEWRHVSTAENPADCASRGLFGDEIVEHDLWWRGPLWLHDANAEWPGNDRIPSSTLEERIVALHCSNDNPEWDLASRYSSWPKLLRVTAYVLKFVHLCRDRANLSADSSSSSPAASNHPAPKSVALSASDCGASRIFWIKKIQTQLFSNEIEALSHNTPLPAKSSLLALRPFLNQDGVLRVGGRLNKAPLPFSFRHPILLSSHPLVTLIARQAHLRTLHAEPQLTLNVLRRDFWIIRARNLVKAVIHICVTCIRERAAIPTQLMGDLPQSRVSASRSFAHCSLDYAGPVHICASAGRGITTRKAYIALFVCLTTRAIHLELVADYATPAFLNAFSRFCARRGLPQAIYSDNETNFVGADRELTSAYRAAVRDPTFLNTTASDNITWHFIPPSAPHFGGLWETGVKSVKTHLRRVLGSHLLTYEEFSTLLCRIEACLNSRPIAALSDTLDDYECLTPGHFLIGSTLTVNPEPSILKLNENRLSRWQLVRQITERFWKMWQNDYLNTLQTRTKWRKEKPPIRVGQLVLLRNATLPPCKWELGRVTQCHAGSDGLVRVVTVKTSVSEYKRPLVKLCLLPIQS
ncbi:uncharacterized protein [Temnothorax nylanderi]|uniref:uncharacterized protein n=1 Tax=Temnothorax nylanderi TaxID=102681 RepID=UPI003A888EF7